MNRIQNLMQDANLLQFNFRTKPNQRQYLLIRGSLNKFNRAHPQFLGAINTRYPKLTKAEIRFCCLTFLSVSDNEMADMLGVGVNSIRVTRNRVRKKLQLGKGDDLEVLLKGF